jgi:hypothetical protein
MRFGRVAIALALSAGGLSPVERLCRADPEPDHAPAHLALALPWIFVLGRASRGTGGYGCRAGCSWRGLTICG